MHIQQLVEQYLLKNPVRIRRTSLKSHKANYLMQRITAVALLVSITAIVVIFELLIFKRLLILSNDLAKNMQSKT